jgi:hypothetical protein
MLVKNNSPWYLIPWHEIPSRFNYVATWADGSMYAYVSKPSYNGDSWVSMNSCNEMMFLRDASLEKSLAHETLKSRLENVVGGLMLLHELLLKEAKENVTMSPLPKHLCCEIIKVLNYSK